MAELWLSDKVNIGKFIDIGIYGSYNYKTKHIVRDNLNNQNNFHAEKVKNVYSSIQYVNNFGYGLILRTGINRYVVYCQYRLNDIFKSEFNYAELPKINLGIQIGLH